MSNKLLHGDLQRLGQHLGYRLNDGGVCRGFSMMLCLAWLAEDEKTLFDRLYFIETYKKDFAKLKQDIENAYQQSREKKFDELSEDEKKLLEIPAFYEGIELFLIPHEHSDLFNGRWLGPANLESIYPFVCSEKLSPEKLSVSLSKFSAFNKEELKDYLKDLESLMSESSATAPILLSSGIHSVCLLYDKKAQEWLYVDTNDFERFSDCSLYIRRLNSNALADSIFCSLSSKKQPYIVLHTGVITKFSQSNVTFRQGCVTVLI